MDLTGRIALVTGGNGGIGLGMAQGLADAGAIVVIAGRNKQKGQAALAGLGPQARFIEADLTGKQACTDLVRQVVVLHGGLNILVANAGTNLRKRPEAYSEAEWHHVIDTNLSSVFFCAQAAYPAMVAAGGGKIITIGSMMSLFGAPMLGPYAASKGGVVQLTKALATAWAAENIQVNAVLPGWIDTDLTKGARRDLAGLNERVLARTAAGRWGTPADLAGIAIFLAGSGSDFVTGTAIPVDGGYAAQG